MIVNMLIDCDCCAMKDTEACGDCVVTVMLGEGPVDIDDTESEALSVLADAGLVPRLRLVEGGGPQTGGPQTGGPQTGGPQTGGPPTAATG